MDTPVRGIGQLADTIYHKTLKQRELAAELDLLKKEIEALQQEAIALLDQQGMTLARGTLASISITEREQVQIEDTDAFYEYILRTEQPYLLQARPASRACQELLQSGETIPGIRTFPIRNLSTRKVSK